MMAALSDCTIVKQCAVNQFLWLGGGSNPPKFIEECECKMEKTVLHKIKCINGWKDSKMAEQASMMKTA
jgi:hypothetical protein